LHSRSGGIADTNDMADLKFAVLFSAVDQLSDKLGAIGDAMGKFTDRVTAGGERMLEWGERVDMTTAVLSEGATKLHEWSEAMSEPALGMQQSMATMAAMTELAGDKLAALKEHAIAFTNTHPEATAEEWSAGFTRMQGVFPDTALAMRAADVSAMLGRFGVDNKAAARLISASWSNLRTDAKTAGDELFAAIKNFGLNPGDTAQFAQKIGRLGGAAAATGTPFAELVALAREANRQIGGGRGAMMFGPMINQLVTTSQKGEVHGLTAGLEQLNAQLSGTALAKIGELEEMGIGNPEMIFKLRGNLADVAKKQKDVAASAGALGHAFGTATADAAEQVKLLHQNVSSLYHAIYSPALSTINRRLGGLTGVTRSAAGAAEHHSSAARHAGVSLTAVGGAAYYGLQGPAALATMAAVAGKGVEPLSKLADWESIALRGMYAWDAIKAIGAGIASFGSAILGAIPSIVGFGLALLANPITWYVAGALALAAAPYEIYEQWGAIVGFFESVCGRVKGVFSEVVDWLKGEGLNMMKTLGEGILAGIEYPFLAAWNVARKVGGLLHFHSPPIEEPLREAVLNFHLGEELTKHIKSGPVIALTRDMATHIASAAPRPAVATGILPVTLNVSYTINASSPEEWVKAARQHADELVRIIDAKLSRRARLEFT
jgi:hypothetical protein